MKIIKYLTLILFIFSLSCASAPKNCKEGDCNNGVGTTIHENGSYKGNFKNSTREGLGEYTFNNGDTYRGNYKNNLRNGEGEYKWKNGDSYRGNWVDGKRNGFGIYTWSDGTRYEGEGRMMLAMVKANLYSKMGPPLMACGKMMRISENNFNDNLNIFRRLYE